MNEKPVKADIDFNEALRRIAQTPKSAVPIKERPPEKKIAAPPKKRGAAKTKLTKET